MPTPEPFTVIALSTSIIANLATDILKHRSQFINNPKIVGWLKQLGLRELEFEERVQELLTLVLELFFSSNEDYRIQGIVNFFRKPEVASRITGFIIANEPINEDELKMLLENHLSQQTVSHLLAKKRQLDTTKVIPDFLACYYQILNTQLDNSGLAVTTLILRSLDETQNQITPIATQLLDYQEQLNRLEANVHRQHLELQSSITHQLSQLEGIKRVKFARSIPAEDTPPMPPRIYAPRKNLVNFFLDQLKQVSWIAIVDGPGKGKTQLARDLAIANKSKMKWISFRGQEGSNSADHFRQQMLSWLVQLSSNIEGHINYLGEGSSATRGISSGLYRQLCTILLDCGPFATDQELKAIFIDARLSSWRNRLPQFDNEQGRVEGIIDFLRHKYNDVEENALVLLLYVLRERIDRGEACHHYLTELVGDLEREVKSLDSNKHERTERLIQTLSQDVDEPQRGYWPQYIEGGLNSVEIAKYISGIISDMTILVIDDLPHSDSYGQLHSDLDAFASIFFQSQIRILTTSQFPLPPSFQTKYQVTVSHVAPLEYDDFVDMLQCVNAPDFTMKPKFIGMLMADGITGKIPSLASVTIDWLERRNWKFKEGDLDAILMGKPAETERQFVRNRILPLLADAPKELMYRLSILMDSFSRELALKIATVTPSIQFPGENFERLTSPWLDKLSDDKYQITPYLRSTGRDNLDEMVQRQVHELVANYYLRDGTISVDQVFSIAVHLYSAEKYADCAAFLVNFMVNGIRDSKQAKYADSITLVSRVFIGTSWPEALDLDWRIMFRAGQVKIRLLAGEDATELLSDLERLIATASTNNWWAVLFARGTLGASLATFQKDNILALIQFHYAVEFVKIFRAIQNDTAGFTGKTPAGTTAQEFLSGLPESVENLIWIAASELIDIEQKRALFDVIRQMDLEERIRLFNADFAIQILSYFFDKIWIDEADKPVGNQDWYKILSFLDEAKEVGNLPGALPLQVIQARARSIVMADYFSADCDEALHDLYNLPETDHPILSFLVHYSIGNCLFLQQEQPLAALQHIESAISTGSKDFSYLYLQSWQIASMLNSRLENWDAAEEKCLATIRLAVTQPELARYERLDMKGELAWIYWSQGNRQKACQAMFGYIMGLVQCYYDPSNKRFRESFNKAGHGLGWFVGMACFGSPPATRSGEPYVDVFAGFFAVRNFRMGDYIQPLGFSRTLMLTQLAMFAYSIGLYRMAWKTHNLMDSMEDDCPNPILISTRYINTAHLAMQFSTPSNAIRWGIRAVTSHIIAGAISQLNTDINTSQATVDEHLHSVDIEVRKAIEREYFMYILLLPSYLNIMGNNIPFEQVNEKLEEFDHALDGTQASLYDVGYWKAVLAFFRQLIPMWDGQNHLEKEELVIPGDHSFLVFIWVLLGSKRRGLSPRERLSRQIQSINHFSNYPQQSRYMWLGIGKFLHKYWSEFPGFSLGNPQVLKTNLEQIPVNLGERTATRVVLTVLPSVDATLSQEDFERFQAIAQNGLY